VKVILVDNCKKALGDAYLCGRDLSRVKYDKWVAEKKTTKEVKWSTILLAK
jgi:hypothetical protein